MYFRSIYLRKCYWLKDFLSGQPMWKSYKEVMYISNIKNIEGAERLRRKRLCSFLDFATSNVTFYKPYKGIDLN